MSIMELFAICVSAESGSGSASGNGGNGGQKEPFYYKNGDKGNKWHYVTPQRGSPPKTQKSATRGKKK